MPLAPANYGPENNIFFNGAADFTVSGLWTFEQTPNFGGGGWDPNNSYSTTGSWTNSGNWIFNGPFNVVTPSSNNIVISNYNGAFPPPPAGDMYLLAEGNIQLATNNGAIALATQNGFDIQLQAAGANATMQLYGNDYVTISSTDPASYIELSAPTETRITSGNLRIVVGQLGMDNLQSGAPMGSVPVMWDPVSKQFYQGP